MPFCTAEVVYLVPVVTNRADYLYRFFQQNVPLDCAVCVVTDTQLDCSLFSYVGLRHFWVCWLDKFRDGFLVLQNLERVRDDIAYERAALVEGYPLSYNLIEDDVSVVADMSPTTNSHDCVVGVQQLPVFWNIFAVLRCLTWRYTFLSSIYIAGVAANKFFLGSGWRWRYYSRRVLRGSAQGGIWCRTFAAVDAHAHSFQLCGNLTMVNTTWLSIMLKIQLFYFNALTVRCGRLLATPVSNLVSRRRGGAAPCNFAGFVSRYELAFSARGRSSRWRLTRPTRSHSALHSDSAALSATFTTLLEFSSMLVGRAYNLPKSSKSTLALKLVAARLLRRYLVVLNVTSVTFRLVGGCEGFKSLWRAISRPLDEVFFHPLQGYLIGDLALRLKPHVGPGNTLKSQIDDFFLLQYNKFVRHYAQLVPSGQFDNLWVDLRNNFVRQCSEIDESAAGATASRLFWNYYFMCTRVMLPVSTSRRVFARKTVRSIRRRISKRITRDTQRRLWVF